MNRVPRSRSRARRWIGAAAVGAMLAGALLPALQLSTTAASVTVIAAVVAAALQTVYVVYDGGALTGAIVVGLMSCVFGATSGPTPRVASFAGALLVFLAAELGRLSLDQRSPAPIEQDPPAIAFRPALFVLGSGAAVATAVLMLSLVRLPSAGVLAVLGAVALVLLAAVLAHPGPMLGGALDEQPDDPD